MKMPLQKDYSKGLILSIKASIPPDASRSKINPEDALKDSWSRTASSVYLQPPPDTITCGFPV
jgi:hypothetical protein